MKPSHLRLVGVSLAFVLAFAPKAQADLIPWAYNWSRSPTDILADAPGTGYISLTDEKQGTVVGNSDIVATNLKTVSTATAANPDVFTAKTYALVLTLMDLTSGTSGTMTFTGLISGTLSGVNSSLVNSYTGQTTQQIILGNSVYTTTIGAYTPPGPPGSSNLGSIGAHATVTVSSVAVESVPEPGTLALSLLGLGAFGACRRWLPRHGRRAIQ